MKKNKAYFKKQAEKTISYWQPILELQSWEIAVRIIKEESGQTWVGQNNYLNSQCYSVIQIVNPEKSDTIRLDLDRYSFEHIVLHELLHLKIKISKKPSILEEEIIDFMARAFLNLRYGVDRRSKL